MYKAEDFNLTKAPKELIQYVIDNVEDFEPRYQYASYLIGKTRCSLEHALEDLYYDIWGAMSEFFEEHPEWADNEIYIEDIFG